MKHKITCGKCEHWIQDEVYKTDGYCDLFTNAVTKAFHICQKPTFESFPQIYYKKN